jgi:Tol biopolymer transport system component
MCVVAPFARAQSTCATSCVSLTPLGTAGNFHTGQPTLTPDGQWLLFISGATDLVAGDTNGSIWDVLRRDRLSGATSIAMTSSSGAQPDDDCLWPRVSADGRYVACYTFATNLVPGDTNGAGDVFVHDLVTGATVRATLTSTGQQIPGYVFTYDLSADGRYVAFSSDDPGIVPGDTNGVFDVFVRDLVAGTTERVSLGAGGAQADAQSFEFVRISGNGRYVLFTSEAGNLAPNDNNGTTDVYLRDRTLGTTSLIDKTPAGFAGDYGADDSWMTPDARFIVFASYSDNLVAGDLNLSTDIFLADRTTGTLELVSVGNGGVPANWGSAHPTVSHDGRFVAFTTNATNLIPLDVNGNVNDVYVRDRVLGTTVLASVSSSGEQGESGGDLLTFSSDGTWLIYSSDSTNLAATDTNAFSDVYLRDTSAGGPVVYCTAGTSSIGCAAALGFSGTPSASAATGFAIHAANLRNHTAASLFYTTAGSQAAPFSSGVLCLHSPLRRLPIQNSGGSTSGTDCTGSVLIDFNARIASGIDPLLIAGRYVWIQCWSRDPGFAPTNNINLSDALWFGIQP